MFPQCTVHTDDALAANAIRADGRKQGMVERKPRQRDHLLDGERRPCIEDDGSVVCSTIASFPRYRRKAHAYPVLFVPISSMHQLVNAKRRTTLRQRQSTIRLDESRSESAPFAGRDVWVCKGPTGPADFLPNVVVSESQAMDDPINQPIWAHLPRGSKTWYLRLGGPAALPVVPRRLDICMIGGCRGASTHARFLKLNMGVQNTRCDFPPEFGMICGMFDQISAAISSETVHHTAIHRRHSALLARLIRGPSAIDDLHPQAPVRDKTRRGDGRERRECECNGHEA
ncbi:hypothetical protein PHLGIDRAFT_16337 [Phlebiopsis gigantea 11061_1 CR5-6]|uniref:Uncharacterized protein n=1 Tax=Phlebiopsis gigantea (strain 11061_1 CR5-6) TaxID=745531 RepID=A0A0C3PCC6_PHLG1|nr:hypothetical protein PHLGIDRAFT_16337 [Phlebiopsis gigantea 11061_1 CR5-6]